MIRAGHLLWDVVERLLGVGVVERCRNRDRRRRIETMLERERSERAAAIDHAEAMTIQLAAIRALPEVPERP